MGGTEVGKDPEGEDVFVGCEDGAIEGPEEGLELAEGLEEVDGMSLGSCDGLREGCTLNVGSVLGALLSVGCKDGFKLEEGRYEGITLFVGPELGCTLFEG